MIFNQDQMQIISNCPVCNSRNFPAHVKIIKEVSNSHILHITCRKCHSNILVMVTFSPQGLMSTGMLTDLTSDEVMKFSQSKPLTADDVLEIQELICKNGLQLFQKI